MYCHSIYVRRNLEEIRRIRDGTYFPEGTDIQQVCLNGHQITDSYNNHPEYRKRFCQKCGKPTITKCPQCKASIPGHHYPKGVIVAIRTPVPSHCHNCGNPYPWSPQEPEFIKISKGDLLKHHYYKEEVQDLCQKSNLRYTGPKEELVKQIEDEGRYSVSDLLNFLSKDRLKNVSEELGEYRSGNKKDLIDRIYPHIEQPTKSQSRKEVIQRQPEIPDIKTQRKDEYQSKISGNGNDWMNEFYYNILYEHKKYQDENGNYQLIPMNQIVDDMVKRGVATIDMKGDIKQSITSMRQEYRVLDFGGQGDYRLNHKGHNLYFQYKNKYEQKSSISSKLPKDNKNQKNIKFKRNIRKFLFWMTIGILGSAIGGLIVALILRLI